EGRRNTMMAHIETKIRMKSARKVSASDRFIQYQKLHPQPFTVSEIRAKMRKDVQASQASRRLAQQLANRPSLEAALGNLNKMSVQQQLGPSNVKDRLSDNAVTGVGGQMSVEQQLGPSNVKARLSDNAVTGVGGQMSVEQQLGPSNVKARLSDNAVTGVGGQMSVEQQLGPSNVKACLSHNDVTGVGGQQVGLGRGSGQRGGLGRGVERRRFQTGGRGGVREQSGGRGVKLTISKEELDNELAEYMSNTKANLYKNINEYIGSPSAGNTRGGIFLSPYGDLHGNRGRGRGGVRRSGINGFAGDLRDRGGNRRCIEQGRFQRGGRGGVRGQSRERGTKLTISKEELDNQLDEYMSNRKAKLDRCIYRPS
ncbi:hypothetical protein CHS0354_027313, partial [Potamilus streckersoni]